MATPTMNEIVCEMAAYTERSGFSVEFSKREPWVAIHEIETDNDVFFLANTEAEEYLSQAMDLAVEAEVDIDTAILAQAKQYIDCM